MCELRKLTRDMRNVYRFDRIPLGYAALTQPTHLAGNKGTADAQWRPLSFADVDMRFKYVDDLLAYPQRYGCANYADRRRLG
ncbi:hypothetical protein GCM10010872_14420 [Dyella flava]|nr:hypothetical protein GCM10010872_14420 [Dyella flava]